MSAYVCQAAGCKTIIPPSMFLCRVHWFSLPEPMRAEIIVEELARETKDNLPNAALVAAVARAREWIAEHAGK